MSNDAPAPRRSTRTQAPTGKPHPQPQTPVKARKPVDRDEQLRVLLYNPKSALVNVDMLDLINASTFAALSPAVRARLAGLLPPTAFHDFVPFLAATHPSLQHGPVATPSSNENTVEQQPGPKMVASPPISPPSSPLSSLPSSPTPSHSAPRPTEPPPREPASTIFTSPHFLSAVRTFQDHLYSGWRTPTHSELVRKFQEGVNAATISVPWKDEVWAADTRAEEEEAAAETMATAAVLVPGEKGKVSRPGIECRLSDLARSGFLKVGDVLAFKRRFAAHSLTVEKDILISSISARDHTICAIIAPSPQRAVPTQISALLPEKGKGRATQTPSVTVASPTQLENEVLDADGRVPRDARPNGNAWKAITVWRLPEHAEGEVGAEGDLDGRGSRENCGTLFYLRSCYLAEQS